MFPMYWSNFDKKQIAEETSEQGAVKLMLLFAGDEILGS